MGRLTTHVLDTANGRPGAGVRITLYRNAGERYMLIGDAVTNQDGRCDGPLLEGDTFTRGPHRLVSQRANTSRGQGSRCRPPFVDEVVLTSASPTPRCTNHVPLLVSPWSFSTYAQLARWKVLRRRVACSS